MSQDEFRQRLEDLIGEAEDSGLALPEMLEVVADKAAAIQSAMEE